jgi:uncharacterized membrane protein
MGLLDWASDHLLTSVVLLLISGAILAVSLLAIAGWLFLLLFGFDTGTLGSLLPVFILATVVTLPLVVASAVIAAMGLAARASAAVSSDRAKQWTSYLERESSLARTIGLSSVVERFDSRSERERADDRLQRLKEKYVDGTLSQTDFERKIREILDQENDDRDRSSVIDEQLRDHEASRESESS